MATFPEEEPLMEPDGEVVAAQSDAMLLEKSMRRPNRFVWLLTFSAGISGLLFGYDTGVISSTLVSIHDSLGHELSTLEKSLVTSATSLFALLVSPLSGILADRLGRKKVVLLADLAFVVGALTQAATSSVPGMIAGRSIVGVAVGAGSFVAPLYISELAPTPFRGRLLVVNIVFITLGQVVAYVIGWCFVTYGRPETGWRWMVGLGAVPAVFQCLIMLFMPDTPRWLAQKQHILKARGVLRRVYRGTDHVEKLVDHVLTDVEKEVRAEDEAKRGRSRTQQSSGRYNCLQSARYTFEALFRIASHRRALTIACLLQGLQQLCGFNSLMYFSATIFAMLEFKNPTLTSLAVALTNFVSTCLALVLIDRIGRRRILLRSLPFMIFGLVACSVGYYIMPASREVASTAFDNTRPGLGRSTTSRAAPIIILTSIMVYVAAYAIGLGNVPWMQSELFPLSIRSLGSGISTSTNWAANFVVGLTFLPMMEFFTPTFTFVVYAVVCTVGWVLVHRFYPETAELSLEQTGALLADGWAVPSSSIIPKKIVERPAREHAARTVNFERPSSAQYNDSRYSSWQTP